MMIRPRPRPLHLTKTSTLSNKFTNNKINTLPVFIKLLNHFNEVSHPLVLARALLFPMLEIFKIIHSKGKNHMTVLATKDTKSLTIGIDRDTLSLMGLELIDNGKGITAILNPGDKIRTGSKDYIVTEDHFKSPDELSALLSHLSGAKVRLVTRRNSGHFYLLFSDAEKLSLELKYVYDIAGLDTPSDDTLLMDGRNKLSAADLGELSLPLNPAENLCPASDGRIQEDCYAAHIDYMSGAFLFYKSVEESAALGASIKHKFETGGVLDELTLTRFFEERHFALQIYENAILTGAQQLQRF